MSMRDDLQAKLDAAKTVREYIAAHLELHLHDRYDALGYWCHRCDIIATPNPPVPADEPIVGGDGWCLICGLNPRWHGPDLPKPTPVLRGILDTTKTLFGLPLVLDPNVTPNSPMVIGRLATPADDPVSALLARAIDKVNAAPPEGERGRYLMHPDAYRAAIDRWKRTGKMPWDA